MARPRDPGSRRSKAERRRAKRAAEAAASIGSRSNPNDRVAERRERFRFLGSGRIDQDIHDGIGQLHALGLLNGHGHEAKDLRDIGRDYADLYWERYGPGDGCGSLAPSTGSFERHSKSSGNPPPRGAAWFRYDKLDAAMPRVGMERTAIHMLVIHHYHSDNLEGWVQRLVNYELAKRGVPDVLALLDSPTHGHDCYMLGCAVRALCQLMDAGLPARFERRAA
jgi:hypothetical protein